MPVAPPPTPVRRSRRFRAWVWISVAVVAAGAILGGAIWAYQRANDPFGVELTVAVDDLAPHGFRQAAANDGATFLIGERSDGTAEVATVGITEDSPRRQRSTGRGPWVGARAIGPWLALFPRPAPDGARTVEVFDGRRHHVIPVAAGQSIMFPPMTATSGRLDYVVFAPAAGQVRPNTAGEPERKPITIPVGATLAGDFGVDSNDVTMSDATGAVYTYAHAKGTVVPVPHRVPAGHPAALFAFDAADAITWYADNKAGYRVVKGDRVLETAPPDRTPVRVTTCRPGSGPALCVIDQVGADPATRELAVYEAAGLVRRGPMPHAVPGRITVAASSTANVLIVPTLENERAAGSVTFNAGGVVRSYEGTLLPVDLTDALLVPGGPADGDLNWAASPQSVAISRVDTVTGKRTPLETVTARPGSCAAANGRLACTGTDDFTVWQVR